MHSTERKPNILGLPDFKRCCQQEENNRSQDKGLLDSFPIHIYYVGQENLPAL